MSLLKEIETLEKHLDQKDILKEKVSKRAVGWHVEHCLKVIYGTLRSLQKSNTEDYKSKFNWKRTLIFSTGYIPRGIGKAPKVVNPQAASSPEELEILINKIKDNLNATQNGHPHSNFNHPIFGLLNKEQSLKFIGIHNKHHLKIIRDILK